MERNHGLLLLVPFCVTLFVHDLDRTDLWSAHEARAAQNAQRMLDDQSFGLPTLYDGQVELQKPPAFYWLVAAIASFNDGKVDRWAVRLPAAIAGLLTVLMVWHFLVRQGRPVAGLIAALVLASSLHFTSLARTGRIDMPLTCAITATMLLLTSKEYRVATLLLASASFAAAILLKGPIGIVLPAAAMVAWVALGSRRRTPPPAPPRNGEGRKSPLSPSPLRGGVGEGFFKLVDLFRLGSAMLLGTALAAPWFVWANDQTAGEFFRVFFWHHHFQRATGGSPALASHPWWYYAPRFALDFLPWTPLLIAAAFLFFRNRQTNDDSQALFGLIWLAAMVSVLSIARFKRADYLLPAYPGAAIFVGCVGERWFQSLREHRRRAVAFGFAMILAGCVGGWWWFHHSVEPKQQAVREQQAFAAHIRSLTLPARPTVLLFRVESHLLAFHLGRPVHTLVEWGELNERLAEPGTHFFVTRAEFVPECLQHVQSRRIEVVAHSADFASAPPLRPLVLVRTVDDHSPNRGTPACPAIAPKD